MLIHVRAALAGPDNASVEAGVPKLVALLWDLFRIFICRG